MKSILTLLIIFFSFILTTHSIAQNYVMESDQTAFHGSAELGRNSFENFYGFFPGYTFDGRLTFSLGLGKNRDLAAKVNSTFIRPMASYMILKQNDESLPISFEINAGYQYNYVQQLIFNSNAFLFGGGIYHEIVRSETIKLIPAVIVNALKPDDGLNNRYRDNLVWSYGVQTTLLANNFYVTPKVTFFDGLVTITGTVGYIFVSQ